MKNYFFILGLFLSALVSAQTDYYSDRDLDLLYSDLVALDIKIEEADGQFTDEFLQKEICPICKRIEEHVIFKRGSAPDSPAKLMYYAAVDSYLDLLEKQARGRKSSPLVTIADSINIAARLPMEEDHPDPKTGWNGMGLSKRLGPDVLKKVEEFKKGRDFKRLPTKLRALLAIYAPLMNNCYRSRNFPIQKRMSWSRGLLKHYSEYRSKVVPGASRASGRTSSRNSGSRRR